ncbi:MAG: methyltransferase [Pseudomonas sp.]
MHLCDTVFASLELDRYPPTTNPTLQPHDTADLYLLQRLSECPDDDSPLLVVNDTFGVLACALAKGFPGRTVHSWGDSHLARLGLENNLQLNGLPTDAVSFFHSQETPAGFYRRVLIRVPKSLALLEDQLARVRPLLAADAQILAGAMIKHLPHSAGDLLARYIGPYQASLGWKKARLLVGELDPGLQPAEPDLTTRYALAESSFELVNLPGVFSRDKLDNGTRALLASLPTGQGDGLVVDLGCGNGALGIMAAQLNPEARLVFVDESYAAVTCARDNWSRAFPDREAEFKISDGLIDITPGSADLILCNPPFHQQQAVGDEMAKRLFEQSLEALKPTGSLMVVGNRHLGYHVKLRTWFSKVEQLSGNPKFVVLKAAN